ncbi:MAG: hypothetical protein IT580_07785 [Verrucomicrobiales bacterium]|nr:hypothetical protein [Verrucomicrobiales bacterium]
MIRRQQQQGIALITTLIMLSVVTLMAVAFLAVSRRERASVTTSSDRLDARAMAEAALQRAEAEVISRVRASSNILAYDLLVSTNYFNPGGFQSGVDDIANVNFRYANGQPVTGDDLLQLYRNLMIDARVPVFIETNTASGEQDFRYHIDFNRNGLVETNGVQIELGDSGSLGVTNFHVGDPEWIGVLRRPEYPHSGSNLFVGRIAYLILPVGKTLDLNFIHNHTKATGHDVDGFMRNQGVGGWELNLAAFLRDLNTNAWGGIYLYRTNPLTPSSGIAFENANTLLRQRYRLSVADGNPSHTILDDVRETLGPLAGSAFLADRIDGYSDGPVQSGVDRPYNPVGVSFDILENDVVNRPWPGSDQPSQYFDPQDLFSLPDPAPTIDQFTNRLIQASLRRSTYDRHTFYRLLGQLGTDSIPANRGKLHLNWDNRFEVLPHPSDATNGFNPTYGYDFGYHVTNFVLWSPTAFFTNAADVIMKSTHPAPGNGVPVLSVTNIQVWPTNYYTVLPSVHRALQLAANIYDATTNNGAVSDYPYLPSVFRPVFGPDPSITGGLRITGYEELTSNWETRLWNTRHIDLDEGENRPGLLPLDRVAGVPVIIGAKKGLPNFNEFEARTTVVLGRKLELVRASPSSKPVRLNQLHTVGISNVFGIEMWNSYRQPYPRELQIRARLEYTLVLSNETRAIRRLQGVVNYTTNIAAGQWLGQQFQIPVETNVLFLPMSAYRVRDGQLATLRTNQFAALFEPSVGAAAPVLRLAITNRLQAAIIDVGVRGGSGNSRLVEYVDYDNLNQHIDIMEELTRRGAFGSGAGGLGNPASTVPTVGSFWLTNASSASSYGLNLGQITEGVARQIGVSLGTPNLTEWNSASSEPMQGQEKEKAIEAFQRFVNGDPRSPLLRMQTPFSPGMKIVLQGSWQVNDPLVNSLSWDITDPQRTNDVQLLPPLYPVTRDRSNLRKVNDRYRPWQRNNSAQINPGAMQVGDFDVSLKDPQIRNSDDWNFPTNQMPAVGWLGRVHRGTPWQTVYLKSAETPLMTWTLWTGHPAWRWPGSDIPQTTHPTMDWRVVDLFTTAMNDNAARGQLSVNQTGLAAWSAALSGVPVLTNSATGGTNFGAMLIEPNTEDLRLIVEGINAARVGRAGGRYNYLGEVLAAPSLTLESPYLRVTASQNGMPSDPVLERIPQMILGVLRTDEPRFVVYAFGQSLRPAPGSVVTDFGPFFQMPTNYTITGEYVTKTLMRLEAVVDTDPVTRRPRTRYMPVKETYNEVPPPE